MKDLKYYAEKSLTAKNSRALECDLTLEVDGEKFRAYEVSIANCDLLFFCDKGTANYLVDTIEDRISGKTRVLGIELFNWERE